MPSFVVKQPNGKLALFSTVVDTFTAYDCSERDIGEALAETHRLADTRDKIKRGVDDANLLGGGAPTLDGKRDGQRRWRACLGIIAMQHGTKALKRVLDTIGRVDEPQAR